MRIKKDIPHIAAYVLLGIVAVLLVVYFAFAAYFHSHYYFHTKIGTLNCGGKTAEYVEKSNTQNADDYLLTVYDRENNKFHLTGSDFGFQYNSTGEEEKILKKQNPFLWPSSLFRHSDYTLLASTSYDADALKDEISKLEFMSADYMTAPTDARIEIEDDTYEIIPETMGTTTIPDEVFKEIETAVDSQETSVTLSDTCYESPNVLSTDPSLQATTDQLDSYMASTITYDIADADEKLTSSDILKMLQIDDNGNVTISDDAIASYVQHLASTYNTYGDKREFTTSKGDVVEVSGGDYGWVIAKAKEIEQIRSDLAGGTPVEREPVYEQTAVAPGPNDIGNTYVELDYSNQHMYYYKDGNLTFDSDIVSGKLSSGNGSPDGVYKIVYKQSPSVLVGETYHTEVQYFVPFAYNVGFHDATWQPKFGGDWYLTHGSHGCINMALDKVQEFYGMIEVGTPVVAYYRTPVELTSESAQISNAASYVDKNAQ